MVKIAIIEDDRGLSNGITLALRQEGYAFFPFSSLAEVTDISNFDLIILDINLPDGNGFDFLKKIRQFSQVPVIILTANDQEMDEVMGLELGADDYITKPFSLMVLRIRVEKALRREHPKTNAVWKQEDFLFDFEHMKYFRKDHEIELSKTEQKLLKLLTANKNNTLTRAVLVDRIWGNTDYVDEHALTVTIKRLRDKLEEDSSHPQFIQTVYGIGYIWRDEGGTKKC